MRWLPTGPGLTPAHKTKGAQQFCCRLSARTVPDEAAVRLGGEGFNSLLGRQAATRPLAEQADKIVEMKEATD